MLDIDRQYSSSSMSSKSPHSPAFDNRPQSSHTSTTSSILFSTSKPPPQLNSKAAKTLGFDFGLPESHSVPVQPPSPTSTVYEVVDSPTVPDYILAEDEPPTVDVVRNHLQRPDTSHTQAPAPNYHEAQFRPLQRKNSRGKKTETVFQVDDGDRQSLFWDDNASVFAYYGELLSGDDVDEMERVIMGEEWIQSRPSGQQPSKIANYPNTPKNAHTYPNPPKSPSNRPPRSPGLKPPPSPRFRGPTNPRESLFDDLPPSKAPLNVKTSVTILKKETTIPTHSPSLRNRDRDSDDSVIVSSIPYKTPRPIQYESGGVLGLGYETGVHEPIQNSVTPTTRSRKGSAPDASPLSASKFDNRNSLSVQIRHTLLSFIQHLSFQTLRRQVFLLVKMKSHLNPSLHIFFQINLSHLLCPQQRENLLKRAS